MTAETFGISPPPRPEPAPLAAATAGRSEGWYVIIPLTAKALPSGADLAEFQFLRSKEVQQGRPVNAGEAAKRKTLARSASSTTPLIHELVCCAIGPSTAQTVQGGISRFVMRRPWWKTPTALFYRRKDWWRDLEVHLATPPKSSMTGESVTLGLALGALMAGARTPVRLIIATGEIDTMNIGGATRRIKPIGGIDLKIAEVIHRWKKKPHNVPFFVPLQDRGGQAMPGSSRQEKNDNFKDLFKSEIAKLAELGITLVPVETLEEAAGYLGATTLAPTLYDRLALGVVAGASLIGVTALGFQQWYDRPVPMEWVMPSPLVRAASKEAVENAPEPMLCADTGYVARTGEWIGIPFRLRSAASEPGSLAVVAVAYGNRDNNGISVLPGIDLHGGNAEATFYNDLGPIAEPMKVTLVAARWPTTSAGLRHDLQNRLDRTFPTALVTEEGRMGKIEAYLESEFKGRTKTTSFDSVENGGLPCR